MKLDKTKKELKDRLEKLGLKVYFSKETVRIFWPGYAHRQDTYTYRQAYRLAKAMAGNGKSVRPWSQTAKEISWSIVRTKVREQINAGGDDVHYPPKLACDIWNYD